jgi:hypothetical protein
MGDESPTPAEDVSQDPGIPGKDVISDSSDAPPPDGKDLAAEDRERIDDPDDEGHMSPVEGG